MHIYHLNCGLLHVPPNPLVSCHCLMIDTDAGITLVDTGIGLEDIARPEERIGKEAINAAGFQFHEGFTAARQIEAFSQNRSAVTDILLTHGDPDHAGGLSDFPAARVHLAVEEQARIIGGAPRYSAAQFAHGPQWVTYPPSADRWFGLESRSVATSSGADIRLIPLFGHTLGHCGVAIRAADRWLLHVGDAYYLRVELTTDDHPVSQLAAARADDDAQRRASLAELRRLLRNHTDEIQLFGYHDFSEFPNT